MLKRSPGERRGFTKDNNPTRLSGLFRSFKVGFFPSITSTIFWDVRCSWNILLGRFYTFSIDLKKNETPHTITVRPESRRTSQQICGNRLPFRQIPLRLTSQPLHMVGLWPWGICGCQSSSSFWRATQIFIGAEARIRDV